MDAKTKQYYDLESLTEDFYRRDTVVVAKELLGCSLVRTIDGTKIVCKIVECEAYYGKGDDASHAASGVTPRNKIMFGPPGRAYVYFNYGVHHLLNIVTEKEGTPGAVLIRAIQPMDGEEILRKNRPVKNSVDLTNGPGKLTQALGIDLEFNGVELFGGDLFMSRGETSPVKIVATERIGISFGKELLYRFYIDNNIFVSRK